jgi:hypothetical protein
VPPVEEVRGLSARDDRHLGVLLLLADPTPMQALVEHLLVEGLSVDTALDLVAARRAFFGAGGHDCLVIAPDVRPGLAARVVSCLRTVDPQLAMATFAATPPGERPVRRTAVLAGYHPGSRAGRGALLRFLRSL